MPRMGFTRHLEGTYVVGKFVAGAVGEGLRGCGAHLLGRGGVIAVLFQFWLI